jgi:hypothetical protein
MAINIADIEKTAANIVNGIIEHETLINMIATTVGIMPAVAIAEKGLPFIVGVLQFLQQESGKPWTEVIADFFAHNTPGQPNIPILGPAPGQNQETSA